MSPPLLAVSGVSKAFAGVQALKGVSFDLRAGEVHALVGENGAGKSTLIKIVTGAHSADAGSLWIQGQLVEHNDPVRARTRGGGRDTLSSAPLAAGVIGVPPNKASQLPTPRASGHRL